jgi:two-component system response regulator NreC
VAIRPAEALQLLASAGTLYFPNFKMLGQKKIRIILALDQALLRQGIRRLLEDEPDMDVVAEPNTAAEAQQKIGEHHPDIVISEPRLLEGLSELWMLAESPHTKILFLSAQSHEESHGLRPHGAVYAFRQTSSDELVEMIRRAHHGRAVVREMPRRGRVEWPAQEMLPRKRVLTAREREVLKLLAEGRTVRSAAAVLGLSVKTVDAHKFNLMRKLGLHNKAELVLWAVQKRILKLPANF